MSQVTFESSIKAGAAPWAEAVERVRVVAGWDNPTGEFFMHLEGVEGEQAGEPVWGDFHLSGKERRTLGVYKAQLNYFGIVPPAEFWDRVERRERNVIHRFRPEVGWETRTF